MRGLGVFLVAATAVGCGYNDIPIAEEQAKAALAEVENQYQRRADLVPNLVATVKGFAEQEEQVLTAVTEARAKASSVSIDASTITDPAAFQAFEASQSQLGGALGRLLVVSERYPDLRSSENFLNLQSQLEGTENRIAIARRDYNTAATQVNTLRRTFPQVIWASTVHSGEPFAYFSAKPGADEAPKVDFGGN
ncbi:MAG: LemA family protein [Myxococcota bacterium]